MIPSSLQSGQSATRSHRYSLLTHIPSFVQQCQSPTLLHVKLAKSQEWKEITVVLLSLLINRGKHMIGTFLVQIPKGGFSNKGLCMLDRYWNLFTSIPCWDFEIWTICQSWDFEIWTTSQCWDFEVWRTWHLNMKIYEFWVQLCLHSTYFSHL